MYSVQLAALCFRCLDQHATMLEGRILQGVRFALCYPTGITSCRMGSYGMQYSSFVCRNFHGDSPLEHRSGFALEANEMAVVLGLGAPREGAEGKPRTFVCIDEFGKGTEDKQATALCAASLKHLDQVLAHPLGSEE